MSDTQKLILWIVIAIVVIAIVAWLLVSSARRRQEEERRRMAGSLRAQAKAQRAGVRQAGDRASVRQPGSVEARVDPKVATPAETATGAPAAGAAGAVRGATEAPAEADVEPAVAAEPTAEADGARPGEASDAGVTDRSTPADEASDAAAPPEEAGRDTGWAGAAGAGAAAGAAGAGAAAGAAGAVAVGGIRAGSFDDDEPDIADEENPFAAPATPVETSSAADTSSAQEVPPADDATTAADLPVPEDLPTAASDVGTEPISSAQEVPPAADVPTAADLPVPEDLPTAASDVGTEPTSSAQEVPPAEASAAAAGSDDDADWVNGPVDEQAIDDRPVDDVVDWINGPSDDETVTMEVPDQAAASPDPEPAPVGRRISSFEEVRDGGYGVGSAAPIDDGAQPLGHAIKAVRDGGAYLVPGSAGYDEVEPDVWFFDERAARAAGYHPSFDR